MRINRPAGFSGYSGAIQAVSWVVVFFFMLYVAAFRLGWPYALLRVPPVMACHLVNFYVCYSWLVPRYYERKRYAPAFAGFLLLLLLLTPIRMAIETRLAALPGSPSMPLLRAAGSRGLRGFVLVSELLVALFASLLRLAARQRAQKKQLAEAERLQLETELRFLKAQTSPHFLFNTINNIYALTLAKSDKAPAALMKLSALLRYLLYECHEKVSLQKEMEALHSYAELFRLRYQWPVSLSISNEARDQHLLLEPLLLLPLLENAVKHSALGTDAGAYVVMDVRQDDQYIMATVVNSKARRPAEPGSGGIGLANIRKRLQILHPGAHALSIHETDAYFSVQIKIPAA